MEKYGPRNPNLRPFIKGVSGNPSGRPRIPADILAARNMTQDSLIRLLNKYLNMSRDELKKCLSDPKASMLEVTVGSIVAKAATGADHQRLEFLLTRMIGKPKESPQELNINLQQISNAELVELGKQAIAVLEAETIPQIQEGTDASADPA